MTQRVSKALLLLAVFVCGLFTISALADSQVRIVRLSDLDGDVQIDHGTGYEKALRNMPITQGVKLWTKAGGLAEVEFEDGSTVRLTPNTIVEFPQLFLHDSGAKVSTVVVSQGAAYFNIGKQKKDEFTVDIGGQHMAIKDAATFRVNRNDARAKLSVSKGELDVQGPAGDAKVAKNHTLDINLSGQPTFEVAKGVAPDQYDKWNKQEGQFQNQYNYNNAATGSWPYSFGLADLNYYGNYFYQPGWGWLWQPYYMGAGWDPFMNGAWSWYPGVGYTFVSQYPWGWMPYRYGNWAFVPGMGWAWQPGGFYSWNAAPVIVDAPAGYRAPTAPVTTVANHPTMAINPVTRAPMPMAVAMREGMIGSRAGVAGGRAGRMVTNVPVHGGAVRPGSAQSLGARNASMTRGTMGPHGTMVSPRGSIARSPAMMGPRGMSVGGARMGGGRMGGFGGMGRAGSAGAAHGSAPSTSSGSHH
jgi:hypothetical protein